MRLRLAACALALASAPALARADTPPTVWDLARNPDAFAQRRLHLRIEADMETAEDLSGDLRASSQDAVRRAEDDARLALESWHGPKDRWLRFDEAWVAMRRQQWGIALPILEQLAKVHGTDAFSREVWQKLAECYVRLERTSDEIHAYDEVLARTTSDIERATPMLNQGEAYMRSGDADGAVARFKDLSVLAARTNLVDISLLTQWDLAVALDRSGDFRSAIEAARTAIHMTPAAMLIISPINTTVYFVPDYERDWYLALGQVALAIDASTPRTRADHWRAAETEMTSYVNGATMHGGDRWLALARRRLDEIRKRRLEADKHAPPPDELTF